MPSSKATKKAASTTTQEAQNNADDVNNIEADVVTMDRRRDERRDGDAQASDEGMMVNPRRKKQRRRHIDPTTCERDYNNDEIEFMRAMDDYKRDSGRMFPTCSEVLEVIRSLGYVRLTEEEAAFLHINDMVDDCDEMMDDFTAEDELEEAFEG